jgi:GNAT superfamily N-acetyltransferase
VHPFAGSALASRLDEALTKEGAAYVEAWARVYPDVGAESLWVGGGCALFTGVDSPVTQTIGLGREREVTAAHLTAVEAFFSERGAATLINLSPFAHPSLAAELGRRGYVVEEFENTMVRSLERLESPEPPLEAADRERETVGSGWEVEGEGGSADPQVRVVGTHELDEWAQVVARGFASLSPAEEPTAADVALARLTPSIADTTSFAAIVEGQIVAGGSLSVHDGMATMFGDATLPEWRGRGAQTALLRARLTVGARAGCDIAAAGASPGSTSQRNMERLGFRVAYTQVMMRRP